jgi:hypothetical protein
MAEIPQMAIAGKLCFVCTASTKKYFNFENFRKFKRRK